MNERKSQFTHITLEFSGAQRAAKIGFGGVIAQRVNAEVASAHALLLDVNVTLMFVGIVGLGNDFHPLTIVTMLMLNVACLIEVF